MWLSLYKTPMISNYIMPIKYKKKKAQKFP